jgi:hypothetical protein
MKVLYVAGLYRKRSCSASIRNVALVNGLVESGCDVTVLTVKFPKEVLDPYLIDSVLPEVSIIESDVGFLSRFVPNIYSTPSTTVKNKSRIRELIKGILYFPGVDKNWLKSINTSDFGSYDLIISSSDTKTSHYVACKIINRFSTKWFQIWGDPWQSDIGLSNSLMKFRASLAEKKILNKAEYIGYVSLPTAEEMQKKYPNLQNKIKFIPRNFFRAFNAEVTKKKNEFNLAYTGVLQGRNVLPILSAIDSYNKLSKFFVKLNVYGRVSNEQAEEISNYDFAFYHGEVSLKDVYKAFSKSDALLYLGNRAGGTQIPGKLYDYFGTNLPILALVEDLDDAVSNFLTSSERCLISLNKEKNINLDELITDNAKKEVLEIYSPKSVAALLLESVEQGN